MPIYIGLLITLIILLCGESCVLFKIWNNWVPYWMKVFSGSSKWIFNFQKQHPIAEPEWNCCSFVWFAIKQYSSPDRNTSDSGTCRCTAVCCAYHKCISFPCKYFCSYYVCLYNLWIHNSFASVLSFQWIGQTIPIEPSEVVS